MAHFAKFTSMRREDKPADDAPKPALSFDYPPGLCLYLGKDEIERLDLDVEGVEAGDTIHMCCMAKVLFLGKGIEERGGTRLELQVTDIACEDEDNENEALADKAEKRYGAKSDEDDGA